MPRRAMWKGKSVWNLTVDDVSDIIDTLNLKEKIEYHDFDAKGAIPGHNILYWRWSWARNPRFLSNCEANYVLPHYFEKAYA